MIIAGADIDPSSTIGGGNNEELKTEMGAEGLADDPGLVYRPLCHMENASQSE